MQFAVAVLNRTKTSRLIASSVVLAACAVAAAQSVGNSVAPESKFTAQQRRYWAFQKLKKPPVPAVKTAAWVRNPIDALVLSKLEEKELAPNPPADRITLIRRATLDLTGLPPSTDEVQAFLTDNSPAAFEKVVDRLLASPQYGERWGRHWLDLARYADTEGFKSDEVRPNIWRYRDYVIQSFNEDKPYDRFIREQIAGDELYPDDQAAKIATGFNRHFPDESNAQILQARRQEILNDITDTVGATFLGLTYGCARCHDHKFDPILHKDYYRLQAFFANVRSEDGLPLVSDEKRRAYEEQHAVWDAQTRETRAAMDKLIEPIRQERLQVGLGRFPQEIQDVVLMPPEKRTPFQWQMYLKAKPQLTFETKDLAKGLKGEQAKEFANLAADLKKYDSLKPADLPVAQVMIDNGRESPRSYVLAVGAWDAPKEEVQPGFLSILDPAPARITPPDNLNTTGRRSALANWLADPENPLTPRVMANRIWHYHFGRGIAATPSDFGVMGERPTNPQLLDYLASVFLENGWSIKKLHRLIMLSNVYQESSGFQKEAATVDPDNKLHWRFERHRLEGEVIRDAMLLSSGKLSLKAGGPGMHPPLPAGTTSPRYGSWKVEEDPAEINRRSVYVFVKRNLIYPMFQAFDEPSAQESCARRFRTVVPTQSLLLMNDELVLQWAQGLAGRVLNDSGLSLEQQIERAYRLVFSRAPNAKERQAILQFLDKQAPVMAERLARNDKVPMPEYVPPSMERDRAAAFVDFCHALLNSNEFLYIN
jgi:hypothetical protein